MRATNQPIYPIPDGFEGKLDLARSQSVTTCKDCKDCVDVHPMTDGEHVLLVTSEGQHMQITLADFRGLKEVEL